MPAYLEILLVDVLHAREAHSGMKLSLVPSTLVAAFIEHILYGLGIDRRQHFDLGAYVGWT